MIQILVKPMKIEHIAIWVNDLECMCDFYMKYFNGKANSLYHNKTKQFESYFITFESGARLELMRKKGLKISFQFKHNWLCSYFSVGSEERVK